MLVRDPRRRCERFNVIFLTGRRGGGGDGIASLAGPDLSLIPLPPASSVSLSSSVMISGAVPDLGGLDPITMWSPLDLFVTR